MVTPNAGWELAGPDSTELGRRAEPVPTARSNRRTGRGRAGTVGSAPTVARPIRRLPRQAAPLRQAWWPALPCHTRDGSTFRECALYSSIRIRGYRGLESFQMQGLGRVNLLVGTNNCGKTSILECIELLRSAGEAHVLSSIAGRRGEWAYTSEGDARTALGPRPELLDVSHLFANHELRGAIHIEADCAGDASAAGWNDRVTVYVEDPSASQPQERDAELGGENDERLLLRVKWSDTEDQYRARVTEEGVLFRPPRLMRKRDGSGQAVQFVRTSGMTAADVARTFSKFVLTPKHEAIKRALRIVEPTVEDLAPIADDRTRFSRDAPGGVVLRLHGVADRVPIGSMGDGMWRMLGLALSIADADGGVLLVDEIDTGLHYSVMENMWRMLSEAAAAWSVQVFATTHSRDCYESLAAISKSDADGVTIQRIDRHRSEAVRFARDAIVAVAERDLEVR